MDEPKRLNPFPPTYTGLTKREEFTKAALQGLLAAGTHNSGTRVATLAVLVADATLKKLEEIHGPKNR